MGPLEKLETVNSLVHVSKPSFFLFSFHLQNSTHFLKGNFLALKSSIIQHSININDMILKLLGGADKHLLFHKSHDLNTILSLISYGCLFCEAIASCPALLRGWLLAGSLIDCCTGALFSCPDAWWDFFDCSEVSQTRKKELVFWG